MQKLKFDSGMVIIEATIVFPVMFLVIFLLIFMGNAYFQKCKIEAIVAELLVDGAAYCADPMLYSIDKNGIIPDFSTNPEPYRYFFGTSPAEQLIEIELKKRLENMGSGLFSGMKPTSSNISPDFINHYIYSTFSIDLEYKVHLPIRLLGAKDKFSIYVKTHAETAVSDAPEFMRNINMVEDYLEQTGLNEKINKAISKAKEIFGGKEG